ncbi:hypothetical protein Tco_1148789 [Tanacetum coccineum]
MGPKRATRANPTAETTTTTTITNEQLRALINQGITDALAARDADRSMNGGDSHNLGTGVRRTERVARECTYQDFMKLENQVKFATCPLLGISLTWWNSYVRMVGNDVAMFPEESDKKERYVSGLPDMIHRSVVASKPRTMQDAIEMAT